ncbi:MAG: glycerophosphodiester phosphodiesterase [Candidatus Njordarchaeum guaymaensis]
MFSKRPLCIAHRGASEAAAENSLKSFQLALEMGADGIELDVHPTKDKKLVVLHDALVDSVTGGSGFVSDYTLSEIKKLDIDAGEKIPTLDEVFRLVGDRGMIDVEIKEMDMAELVVREIEKHNMIHNVIVTSFYDGEIQRVKELNPNIKTGLLLWYIPDDLIIRAKKAKTNYILPNIEDFTEELYHKVKESGMDMIVWTVNKEEDMRKLIRLGVLGVITDKPEIFIRVRDLMMYI